MSAGPSRLIYEFVSAIDEVVLVLGVEAQIEKSQLGLENDTISTRNADGSWDPPVKGSPIVLGKEFVLSQRLRKDTKERLATSKVTLCAILAQAQSDPQRKVFAQALKRVNGCVQFETETCKALRSFLSHSYRSAHASDKLPPWQTDKAQKTFKMQKFATEHMNKPDSFFKTPAFLDEWTSLNLGLRIPLNAKADEDLEAYLAIREAVNAEVFLPRRSPPDLATIYILSDSAGLEILQTINGPVASDRPAAGASWFYCPQWSSIPFIIETWEHDMLEDANSTETELSNMNASLRYAMVTWPNAPAYVEVSDSQAATALIHKMSAKQSECLRSLLRERTEIRKLCPQSRILSFWQRRELGWIADLLSKFNTTEARIALAERFPQQPLEKWPRTRSPTLLNALWRTHGSITPSAPKPSSQAAIAGPQPSPSASTPSNQDVSRSMRGNQKQAPRLRKSPAKRR